jgi:hypothetical protein
VNNRKIITHGIKLLVKKCRNEYRRPEKMDYYSLDRYKKAEKRVIKHCLCGKSGHSMPIGQQSVTK